jgi:putative cell wall-binding protein
MRDARRFRIVASLLGLLLIATLMPAWPSPSAANPAEWEGLGVIRLEGDDPVSAALSWSRFTSPVPSREAVLGRDDVFADSLASSALQFGGPLLLTRTDTLLPEVVVELERLETQRVHLLGGPTAISAEVEHELRVRGYETVRYHGATRIETAILISRLFTDGNEFFFRVYVARAYAQLEPTQAFADALALGAHLGWNANYNGIVLTETEQLTGSTRDYLDRLARGGLTAVIAGGTAAVGSDVEHALGEMGAGTVRLSGANRFATAVALAPDPAHPVWLTHRIILVDGVHPQGWAPGFAAAAQARLHFAPILLSTPEGLPAETRTYLETAAAHHDTSTMTLVCAPFVTERACTEAAEALRLDVSEPAPPGTPNMGGWSVTFTGDLTETIDGCEPDASGRAYHHVRRFRPHGARIQLLDDEASPISAARGMFDWNSSWAFDRWDVEPDPQHEWGRLDTYDIRRQGTQGFAGGTYDFPAGIAELRIRDGDATVFEVDGTFTGQTQLRGTWSYDHLNAPGDGYYPCDVHWQGSGSWEAQHYPRAYDDPSWWRYWP